MRRSPPTPPTPLPRPPTPLRALPGVQQYTDGPAGRARRPPPASPPTNAARNARPSPTAPARALADRVHYLLSVTHALWAHVCPPGMPTPTRLGVPIYIAIVIAIADNVRTRTGRDRTGRRRARTHARTQAVTVVILGSAPGLAAPSSLRGQPATTISTGATRPTAL
ncbi:hypothetical protein BC628DRAFT_976963 [Trametes gibbosa]|nr:hypothetical protein BC628DRAFT_976963 [Trametes gibbosa]